jgi:hypothetical protein
MAHGRDFRRAIDRLVSDLTRVAELAIAQEVERAIDLAVRPIEIHTRGSASTRGARRGGNGPQRKSRAERALERHAKREAERLRREAERSEREAERLRRKSERDQLRQELKAARDMARQARAGERTRAKQQKVGLLEEREKARVEKLAPPPLVVFKRSRDGQVTVLKPRPVESGEAPANPPSAQLPSP